MIIVFHGRNTEGILADALREFPVFERGCMVTAPDEDEWTCRVHDTLQASCSSCCSYADEPSPRAIVIARDGDQLPVPDGLTSTTVSQFVPVCDEHYVLIANGGTAGQLLPVVKRLVEAGVTLEAWDLQRDGKTRVW